MRTQERGLLIPALVVMAIAIALLAWWLIGSSDTGDSSEPYLETFADTDGWPVGEDADATALLVDGRYEMTVQLSGDVFWATAGQHFADGVFEVEAFPLEGTLDNGYGMLFRVDEDDSEFYLFKVSSDGYVFIGHCRDSCAETEALLGGDWFISPAVKQGFGVTNRLRINADGPRLTFFVNDNEVGQVTDNALRRGDIGLLAETLAPGGLRVAFDNFTVTPLDPN